MKTYKEVVKNRYDMEKYDANSILEDKYSFINPVGFYGEVKLASVLRDFIRCLCKNKDLHKIRVLDVGCGIGIKTRFLAEFTGNPSNVYGVEYSKKRLEYCKKLNSSINYEWGNIIEEIPKGGGGGNMFDGIISFTVLSHFSTDEEIEKALQNIYSKRLDNGLFLWFDINAKSHKQHAKYNGDSYGFSGKEMDRYAERAGFKLVKSSGLFKRIPFINTSTYYLAAKIKRLFWLEAIEGLLAFPLFSNAYNIKVYRK